MKTNILYVDDEVINIELFQFNFKRQFDVHTAISGKQGLQVLDKNDSIDIVITDMRMPQMSGIEFIHLAKEKFPSKKYLLLTGYGLNDDIQLAMEKGLIDRYIEKPIKIDNVVGIINELM